MVLDLNEDICLFIYLAEKEKQSKTCQPDNIEMEKRKKIIIIISIAINRTSVSPFFISVYLFYFSEEVFGCQWHSNV